jgi:hypothetical protein
LDWRGLAGGIESSAKLVSYPRLIGLRKLKIREQDKRTVFDGLKTAFKMYKKLQ